MKKGVSPSASPAGPGCQPSASASLRESSQSGIPDAAKCLIWSIKWGRWHRRSADGQACGYTDDILRAGIFDGTFARGYDDGETDMAVPVEHAEGDLQTRSAELRRELREADRRRRIFAAQAIAGRAS